MKRHGEITKTNGLIFERILPGPITLVWEYITDAEKRKLWFCGGTTGLNAGDEMSFVFHNSLLGSPPEQTPEKYLEFGDGFESRAMIIKSQKPNLYVIEWEGVVTFKLEEVGSQVKLTLTHDKLQDSKEARVGTLAGWHTHLNILEDQMNGVGSNGFWSTHMSLEDEYELRLD